MELYMIISSFYPLLLAFVFSLFVVARATKRYSRTKKQNSKVLPGPWKLPIIGNLHQLFGLLPHHALTELSKKHGPIMHLQLGEVSTVVASSAKMAKLIMKTHDITFADRGESIVTEIMTYNYTDVTFAPYGDYWRHMRKIFVLELLSTKRVQFFRSIREEEVSNLIHDVSSIAQLRTSINLTERISSLTNDVTARAAFGKVCKDKATFISSMRDATRLGSGFAFADLFPSLKFLHVITGTKSKAEMLHQEINRILGNILNAHREKKVVVISGMADDDDFYEEDFVDVLLRLQGNSELEYPLTDDNIKAILFDTFTAGTDPASTTIEWAMSEILKNARVMKKAQDEVRHVLHKSKTIDETELHELIYLKQVINETLRLHPPLPLLLPRQSRESCEIDGYELPNKCKVIVNALAIGKDPEYWSDPESFKPERFDGSPIDYKGTNFEYIPFGAGRRMCPGMNFGIALVEVVLAQLLYHFDWKLTDGLKLEDLDMSEIFGISVRRKNDLCLMPITYSPSLIYE
ncbi:premnaspirodiene oxygenase-like [Papaver somniferum]|uniref:premnaspirodiene oxygenase-like n=1 Tax=Papaver somniferum TaxID=3469 RepID=UPI000E6FEEAF|nr:premnaspirodiene oxygenase-like [Papaver somniferum]